MHRPSSYQISAVLLIFTFFLYLVWIRAGLVDRSIGTYLACPDCLNLSVLRADLLILYLLIGTLLLAGVIRHRFSTRILHLALGFLLVVYVADLLVFRLFNYRLFLADTVLYFKEWETVWDQFSSGVGSAWTAVSILMAAILWFVFLFFMPAAQGFPARVLLGAALAAALVFNLAYDSPPFVNSWATENVVEVNLGTAERVHYSAEFVSEVTESQSPGSREVAWQTPPGGGNVVLVILESWSSWTSQAFGGLEDWTPELDAAARRGRQFNNFHSIGFATVNGLVGLLGGLDIWSPFLPLFERTPFHSAWGIARTLPRVFRDSGYETSFLTTGPLTIYRKGEWLKEIGFEYVEGAEYPGYADEKRFAFKSASDAALYRRAGEWMQTAKQPWFLVLETISTHQPYKDPVSGERSLEKAMKFADRAFGDFLKSLDEAGFFEHGTLVVASDHRSMTPVPREEFERIGPDAISRVPAFAIGKAFPPGSVDDRVFSQGDLVPTFEVWTSGAARLDPQDAIMLGQQRTPKCAFHERGDRRGVLLVICPEGHGEIYLNGDNTRFTLSSGLDETRERSLLATVARERIAGLRRHERTEAGGG